MPPSELDALWDQGYIPTSHQLRAALHVAERLSDQPVPIDQVRASYAHIPSDGLLDPYDFRLGEELLVHSGVAHRESDSIRLIRSTFGDGSSNELERQLGLLADYLASVIPPWIGGATRDGELHLEAVPDEAVEALGTTLVDPGDREAFLLQLGVRFDDRYQRELGLAGERLVVAECRAALGAGGRPDLADLVAHVSQESDMLGYDVTTPAFDGAIRRLEVKTSGRATPRLRVLISRNEARRAKEDGDWRLIVCRRQEDQAISLVGWCHGVELLPLLPSDSPEGRWMSAEIEIDPKSLVGGLPL